MTTYRELHDGVLGRLYGIRMGFGFLNIEGDESTIKKFKLNLGEMHKIEKEIRNISHDLQNEISSSNINFITYVENLLLKQSEIGNFKFTITCDDKIRWKEIDERVKIDFYRIIQEIMLNINKYAKTSKVNINFALIDKIIKFAIEDNGIGFNTKKRKGGIGLKNIKLRINNYGGKVSINSNPNEGTLVTISISI